MRKYGVMLLLFSVFFVILAISFVSADTGSNITQGLIELGDNVWTILKPLASFLLGATTDQNIFFGKILLFIILLSVIWLAARQLPILNEHLGTVWVISAAVALLSIRFLSEDWIQTIILPYSAFGIAVTTFLPLALYFFLVEVGLQGHRTMRKTAWIVAAVIFMGLYFTRKENVAQYAYFYLIAMAVSLLFLFIDRTIQRAWKKSQYEAVEELHASKARSQIAKERAELEEERLNGTVTDADYRRRDDHLTKLEKKYGIK